jgi:putative ABC transport system permease protein
MWSLQAASDQPWSRFAAGEGVMVNEQLARRYPLAVGDSLVLTLEDTRLELPVLAIYADYGRPAGEVLINLDLLPAGYVPAFESFSISTGASDIAVITDGLQRLWQTDIVRVRDNKRIRELADAVFDQTFLLTRAMTFVTLVLAAVALLIMGWVFFSTRAWYFRLLQVWGLTRRQVLAQLGQLALTLTLSITLLALPLGVWLTWVLVHRINPLAFGWSLPMAIYPGFWLQLGIVSALIGLSITLLMQACTRKPRMFCCYSPLCWWRDAHKSQILVVLPAWRRTSTAVKVRRSCSQGRGIGCVFPMIGARIRNIALSGGI